MINSGRIMMECEYCNRKLGDQDEICTSCGAPVNHDKKDATRDEMWKQILTKKTFWQRNKKKIIIGVVVFFVIGGLVTFLQSQEIEYKAYKSAEEVIEQKWRVYKMFDYSQKDIVLSDDDSGYCVYGVIREKVKDSTYKTTMKSVKCFVPKDNDNKLGKALCEYDVDGK